jgi:beta-galactosidase
MAPHWNWAEGKSYDVRAFVNVASAELFLNGVSLGRRQPEDRVARWENVPYTPGTLRVVGMSDDGRVVAKHELRTAGKAAKLVLESDRSTLPADGRAVAHLVARVVDKSGNTVPGATESLQAGITGPGRILALDNGDLLDTTPYPVTQRECRDGCCLILVQSLRTPGAIRVTVRGATLGTASIELSADR